MIEIIKPAIFVFGILIFVLMAIPVIAFDVVMALIGIAIDDLYDYQEGK